MVLFSLYSPISQVLESLTVIGRIFFKFKLAVVVQVLLLVNWIQYHQRILLIPCHAYFVDEPEHHVWIINLYKCLLIILVVLVLFIDDIWYDFWFEVADLGWIGWGLQNFYDFLSLLHFRLIIFIADRIEKPRIIFTGFPGQHLKIIRSQLCHFILFKIEVAFFQLTKCLLDDHPTDFLVYCVWKYGQLSLLADQNLAIDDDFFPASVYVELQSKKPNLINLKFWATHFLQ